MIGYNLAQYLVQHLPSYEIVANGWSPDSPQDSIVVIETGGDPAHWHDRTDWAFQFMSRADTVDMAKEMIEATYALLKNKFGVVLPEITVQGRIYPEVKTYQIVPIQSPAYIGADERNLEMFSFNSEIVTK